MRGMPWKLEAEMRPGIKSRWRNDSMKNGPPLLLSYDMVISLLSSKSLPDIWSITL
jgi:hypothetical protein